VENAPERANAAENVAPTPGERPLSTAARGSRPPFVDPDPPAAFEPFINGEPEGAEAWWRVFLVDLAKHGRPTLAAYRAGVHPDVARAARRRHRALGAEASAARSYYKATLERHLAVVEFRGKGNVLAGFGALKRELPRHYVERAQQQLAIQTTNIAVLDADEGARLLAAFLSDLRPAARAALEAAGNVLPAPETA
jgi:hypothetical protein